MQRLCISLATRITTGKASPKDYEKAIELFTKSAEQDYIKAQNHLASIVFWGLWRPTRF